MKHPKLTVLMSVYNDQGYLSRAVESILKQTFADFEFLIIDDGSSQPLDALESVKDSRIRVHRHENMGLTRSLNRGIDIAAGEFIARMDADDVSAPNRLELQLAELESDSRLDLVGSFFDIVDAEERLIERKELITDSIYRLWRLQFHNNYGHGTVMFRKKSVTDIGKYDEGLRYAQDFDLWSRLSGSNNTSIIPEVLYSYRLISEGQQASVRNYDAQLATAIDISNRSLRQCNPALNDKDCEEIRALYWKFQLENATLHGIELIPSTFKGFCRRYGITTDETNRISGLVTKDVLDELEKNKSIPAEDMQEFVDFLYGSESSR